MGFKNLTLWFLCVHVVYAAGDARKLRGSITEPHLWPTAAKLPWRIAPGLIEKKPDAVKKVESFHDEWIRPVSSVKNFAMASWIELFVSMVIWMTLVVVAAFMYKQSSNYLPETGPKPVDPEKTQQDLSDWQSKWYQCYNYPDLFLWACCCPCVRWAHTMDLLQFLDYWPAFLVFFVLSAMNQLTGFVFIGIFLTMVLVFYRQKMRKLFGMQNHGTFMGYAADCLGFCFCWPCFIAQEAHHISQASKLGWTKDLAIKSGFFSSRAEPFSPTI